ncbi:extracellular solute-binding protein [Paenarthrobacter sp. A20]|uniref:extracellular solute-binding protein n=1 Tax=Paenarthrobacter sp. A20 TaxID=2817891 RepID=UPI0020A2043D|nr:extracellular solute-binding protein [Paenarthrobacter sp. A20]MCP1415731.1 multiple sugar transport system substrate-binding protein [Paenarthrobacter sp. A20]
MFASTKAKKGIHNTRIRKGATLIAALTSITLLATGCGASGSSSAAPAPGKDKKYSDFAFTSWNYGEDAARALLEEEVAGFTDGKGIKAKFSAYPFAEYRNQILLRARTGDIDGAAQLDIADLQSLAQSGKLVNLSAYVPGSDYTDASLKTGQYEGKQYGLPWYTGSIGLVTNTALLKQAGFDKPPTTIKEFEQVLKSVAALGDKYVPYALATKPEQVKDFFPWFKTFGSKIVEGDTIAVNDEGAVKALTWLKSLYDQNLIRLNVGRPEARTLFSQEQTAFFDDASMVRGTVKKQATNPELVNATTPMARPVVAQGDKPQSLAWGSLLVVFDKGAAETSADFAHFMSSDIDTSLKRYKALGSSPTTNKAIQDPTYSADPYSATWQKAVTDTADPNPLWKFTNYGQMEAKLASHIQAALIGEASPKDALDAAAKEMQDLVGK